MGKLPHVYYILFEPCNTEKGYAIASLVDFPIEDIKQLEDKLTTYIHVKSPTYGNDLSISKPLTGGKSPQKSKQQLEVTPNT